MSKRAVLFALFALSCVLLNALVVSAHIEFSMIRKPRKPVKDGQVGRRFRSGGHPVPLGGNFDKDGEYFMTLEVGTPAKTFVAQVDTGSSDFAVPSSKCTNCGQTADPYYNPAKSSTSKVVSCNNSKYQCSCSSSKQCEYTIGYGDGSGFTALVYTDVIGAGDLKVSNAIIGGIDKEVKPNGPFEPSDVDGIIGFAYSAISEIQAPTFFESLVNAGLVDDVFSMCMTEDGGALILGGTGSYYSGSIQYSPLVSEQFYQVHMLDMMVDNSSIGVSSSIYNGGQVGAVVDSGTTDFVIPFTAYAALEKHMRALCSSRNIKGVCDSPSSNNNIFSGYCISLSSSELAQYPDIQVVLANEDGTEVVLTLPPNRYMVQGRCTDASSAYGLAIDNAGDDETGTIIGDVVMQGYTVVFDRANKRVGFADVEGCPSAAKGALSGVKPQKALFRNI